MARSDLNGRFVWYELMTTSSARAEAFYRRVVGWGAQPYSGALVPYTTFTKGSTAVAGMMELPADAGSRGARPHWILYVGCTVIEPTVKRAESLGGRVVVPPEAVPGIGSFAVLADPQGARLALLQPAEAAAYGPEAPPDTLDISWRELGTTDPAAALSFYTTLFNWTRLDASDMGSERGVYQQFGRAGVALGGVYRSPPGDGAPPYWLPYAKVNDIHARADAVKTLGGTLLSGPMEVPGGDLVCHFRDPQGALFALHQAKR
jgi:uncharacterized protein